MPAPYALTKVGSALSQLVYNQQLEQLNKHIYLVIDNCAKEFKLVLLCQPTLKLLKKFSSVAAG